MADQPKCAICLGIYTEPKFLYCFHVYCQSCLKQLVDRDKQGQLSLACPTCRQITPIPAKGVAGLQSLLYVSHLLEVLGRKQGEVALTGEKEQGGGASKTPEDGDSADQGEGASSTYERKPDRAGGKTSGSKCNVVRLVPHGNITLCCAVHSDNELKLYCEPCGHLVCRQCCTEKHHSHGCKELGASLANRENGCSVECPAVDSIECDLVSEVVGSRARGTVERRGQRQYRISYQPTIKGRHQLHVKVEGQHVPGSPFSVAVTSPVENLSIPLRAIGKVQRPWGVAITRKGEIVVAEYSGHKISILTSRGERRCSFGSLGSAPGQFDHPCELTVDGKGNIVVADSWNHRIQKFSPNGKFIKQCEEFDCPIGITFNAFSNKLYVVDRSNKVTVLDSNLTPCSEFGEEGNKEGQFNTPWSITCDTTGRVYVADSYNSRIQVFTAEGEFLWLFGRRGHGRGELGWPAGVAVDSNGMLYISEGDNNRVSVFTAKGQFVTSFGRKGERGFDAVRGVAVDNSGVVYVCSKDHQMLQLF